MIFNVEEAFVLGLVNKPLLLEEDFVLFFRAAQELDFLEIVLER